MNYLIRTFLFPLLILVYLLPFNAEARPPRETTSNKEEPAVKEDPKKTEDKDPAPFSVEVISDIRYRTDRDADPEKHKLDLYLPKGQKDFPVVFFVHGGSWKKGFKEEYKMLGELFAGQGIGTVIINYRLSPQVQHPAHIQDVARAFAWTRTHIAEYGGKPDQIVVFGHSAGGQLVALLATDEQYLKDERLSRKDIRAVITVSGVPLITPVIPVFRQAFGKSRDVCRDASPLYHIDGKLPPFLLLYADHDILSLGRMNEDFRAELQKNGTEVISQKVDNRNHVTVLTEIVTEGDPTRELVFQFLARQTDWRPAPGSKINISGKKP
ncbi:MAG TPA: alpha/beta hydrolase [Gemmataceae bacterium]|nr:alpha/beta hydrolase [Gemmataceae bacterium]